MNDSLPMPAAASPTADFLVVGIGASAGGIAALRTLFEHLPATAGVVYVVVVHLSPEHESHDAGGFRRVLKPAQGGEAQAAELAHNTGKPGTAHALLHHGQNLDIPPGVGMDHPVEMQPGTGQRRREPAAKAEHQSVVPRLSRSHPTVQAIGPGAS